MKAETIYEAELIKQEMLKTKSDVSIYKFTGKRKYQYFIGSWWEWLRQIS